MQAGKLRHQVDLQSRTLTADAYGGQIEHWSTFATDIWASIEPLTGSEQWRAQQAQSSTTHKVMIRYLAGVTTTMRVKFGMRYLNIGSIINEGEKGDSLELMCTEAT